MTREEHIESYTGEATGVIERPGVERHDTYIARPALPDVTADP